MTLSDWFAIAHPAIAVVFVFPILGIVVYQAWLTRQRRLAVADGTKSPIPAIAGREHVRLGRWLSGSVVGVSLLAFVYVLFWEKHNLFDPNTWAKQGSIVSSQLAILILTIASFATLYQATERHWRAIFASLTGIGFTILACQDGMYRRDDEWLVSHFYYGVVVSLLMVFALAILPEIYRDQRWRLTHIIVNILAILLFLGQGITGSRDLLEIPLSWQKPTVFSCDAASQTCPGQPPPK